MTEFEKQVNRFLFRMNSSGRRRLWLKLAKLLSNGVPIMDALGSMNERRIASAGKTDGLSIALTSWMDSLRNGSRLSDAIKNWVDNDEQMLIAAGEQSGSLHIALVSVAEIMEAKKKIKAAVIGGLAYPLIMLLIALSVLIMFSYKIIPEFSAIVPDDKWHGIARIIIDFANFTRSWLWLILLGILGSLGAFFMSLPRWTGGLRIRLDKHAPYSIYRVMQGGSWMISFAALVSAGVRVENALQYLARDAAPWLRVRTNACLAGMRSGLNVGDALARSGYGFPDLDIIDDLGVYSKLSGFDVAAAILGKEWIVESVERIQSMMKIIFGVSVLSVGLFIAFMVGGLIGMELQMSSIMQSSYK